MSDNSIVLEGRCRNGHIRTTSNTYVRPSGVRQCAECSRERQRRLYQENPAYADKARSHAARTSHGEVVRRQEAAIAQLKDVEDDGEIWRAITGFEGIYQVSDRGRVRSVIARRRTRPGMILRPLPQFGGYLAIQLFRGDGTRAQRKIHHLVLESFLGPRPFGLEVNHLDANVANNALGNLEYVTKSENQLHAWRLGHQTTAKQRLKGIRSGEVRRARKERATA